jgi:hypothetical protein
VSRGRRGRAAVVSRLAAPGAAPTGETIGRIADVVIARRESGRRCRAGVHGDGRAPIFPGPVGTGARRERDPVHRQRQLRPFQQREGDLVVGELLDSGWCTGTRARLRLNDGLSAGCGRSGW